MSPGTMPTKSGGGSLLLPDDTAFASAIVSDTNRSARIVLLAAASRCQCGRSWHGDPPSANADGKFNGDNGEARTVTEHDAFIEAACAPLDAGHASGTLD